MSGLEKFFRDDDRKGSQSVEYASPYFVAGSAEAQQGDEPNSTGSSSIAEESTVTWKQQWGDRKEEALDFFGQRITGKEGHPEIPLVTETILDATRISELNLHTRSLNLDLCRVERYWEMRSILRGKKYPITLDHLQDDGGLAVLFKVGKDYGMVISMELLVHEMSPSKVREQAQKIHGVRSYSRLRAFFYNKYAVEMAELLRKTTTTKRSTQSVFLALKGIPAQCILRHDQDCWYDEQDTCPYAVGIGDLSMMEKHKKERMRFDDTDKTVIEFLRVEANGDTSCYRVTPQKEEDRLLVQHIAGAHSTVGRSYEQLFVGSGTTIRPDVQATEEASTETRDLSTASETVDVFADVRRARASHTFTPLADLHELHANGSQGVVNVCAVVLSYTQPFRSKRGDWTMTITLVDDSLALSEDEVASVNTVLFVKHDDLDRLPKIEKGGDIAVLLRLSIQSYRGEVQLLGRGRRQDAWIYFVYRKRANDKAEQRDDDTNNDRLDSLWRWGQKRFLQHATIKQSHQFTIADMQPQENTQIEWYGNEEASRRGDITVLVTAILPTPDNMELPKPKGFLRVWDGTGPPSSDFWPLDTAEAQGSAKSGDPPQVVLSVIADLIRELAKHDGASDLSSPPKKLSGRVANVAVWEKQHWELFVRGIVNVGSLIRLRNVCDSKFLPSSHFRCLHISDKSTCTPLPPLTREVVLMLERHDSRLKRKDPPNPNSAILPLEAEGGIEQPTTPRRPIAELVNRSNITLDNLKEFSVAHHLMKFVGLVRIVGIKPDRTTLLNNGMAKICPKRNGRRFYQFIIRFEQDSSAVVVEALIADAEPSNQQIGEDIFGMTAARALVHEETAIANATNVINNTALWHATIKTSVHRGQKFFVVTALKQS